MDNKNLKQQMMGLWKENFHDSDEYIQLVFDAYFDPDYVEYEERDGRVVASLLAIPYTFGNNKYAINSVYLCGLSTNYKYRSEGIMSRLLHKIEEKMRSKGVSFMFLIPANSGLRRYYKDRGYLAGFYRSALHYTSLHNFDKEFLTSLSHEEKHVSEVKKHYYEGLNAVVLTEKHELNEGDLLHRIIQFILKCEQDQKSLSLYQNEKNIEIFLNEALISKGRIGISFNRDNEISGIAIYAMNETELIETGRYTINYGSLCKVRAKILTSGDGRSLTIYQYGFEKSNDKSLWNPFTSAVLPEANQVGAVGVMERVYDPNSHSEVYGMVRILSISEILKFQSKCRKDLKYSILVRLENTDKIIDFSVKNGQINESIFSPCNTLQEDSQNIHKNKNKMYIVKNREGEESVVMNERDLGEILFRRPGIDRLVEEVFGIPALNGKISLLLD